MKLISLYVENFGGLSGFSLDFEAGLTAIEQPNGFGKTTLSEFIRAMFFGFPRKVKTLEKSKRQKYAPWNGGSFGGNLVFEQHGTRYRIERTFGAVPKADTFTLIDLQTGRKTNRYSEEIGVELFGIDADSFERSIYLPQSQEDGPLATASIQAKLTNLVEGDPDVANFDRAMAQLRAKRSALIPYRGSGGAVAEAVSQISHYQMQLDRALTQQEEQDALEKVAAQTGEELENVREALARAGEELASASEMAVAAAQQRQYDALQQRHRAAAAQLERLQQKYPGGFPEAARLENAEKTADRLAVLEAQIPAERRKTCEKYGDLQSEIRILEQTAARLQSEQQIAADTPKHRYIAMLLGGIIGTVLGAAALIFGAVLMLGQILPNGLTVSGIGAAILSGGVCLLVIRHRKRFLQTRQLDFRRTALEEKLGSIERQIAFLRQDAAIKACREELDVFFEGCAIVPESDVRAQLRRIREELRDAAMARRMQQELARELHAMEEACGDALRMNAADALDLAQLRLREKDLRQQLPALESRLARQKQQIRQLRECTEEIPQLRENVTLWQQRREEYREKVKILDDTMDFLLQARERLSSAYLDTVRSRFGHYLTRMAGNSGETYFMDTEFRVQLERMGQSRELAYFSAGQTDLVMLCMRLALVDALFSDQEMFVILDDPFVNLDDVHMAQARKLLGELAKQRQILYLTCHSSRMM